MCLSEQQVFVMLIILQAISHFQEAILPLLIRKAYTSGVQFLIRKYPKLAKIMTDEDEVLKGSKENNNASTEDSIWNPASLGLQTLDATDPRIDKSKAEGEQDPYEVRSVISSNKGI